MRRNKYMCKAPAGTDAGALPSAAAASGKFPETEGGY